MMNFSDTTWSFVGLKLHVLFSLAVLVGIIFFVVWALRNLAKKQLLQAALWMIVVGLIGALLTTNSGLRAVYGMMDKWQSKEENKAIQSMMNDLNQNPHNELNSPQKWREYMLKQMKDHMDVDE